VIGHRGAAGVCPENTLLSFETALASGAQILESDIHLSKDGIPILLHDPTLERTTDGRGPASQSTWAKIRELDAGSRFENENGDQPFSGKGIGIPSLEEAFEHFPDARFNLEIKCPSNAGIQAVLDLVERFDRSDRTLLAAGDNAIMRALRAALPSHPAKPALGASLEEIIAAVAGAVNDSPMPGGVMALQVPATFADKPLVTRAFVEHAHAHEIEVHVWTINELDEISALLDLGVDGIVTDYPGRMHDWLDRAGRH